VVPAANEVTGEVDVANTEHHKQIVKARNEYYTGYRARFEDSVKAIVARFDDLRKEELRFNNYWA